MALAQRMKAAVNAIFGDVQAVSGDGWLIRAVGGGKTNAGVAVSEWTSITLPAVWACVTLIKDVMEQLPVDVVRKEGNRRIPMPDHPVAHLLNGRANPEMNAPAVVGTWETHSLLWGNGYAEIQVNQANRPIALWPLLPYNTTVEPFTPAGARNLHYRTTIEGKTFDLPPERIIHVKDYSFDGVCGISPIRQAREAVGWGLAMQTFGSKFFANDAKSGGFLQHPMKLSDAAKKNIRDSFSGGDDESEGAQGGLDEAHRIKVLEEGMKYIPTTIPPDDAQFLESREFQLAEIARMFRVPLVLLQSIQGSTVWGTGIEQLMIGFVVWTIAPRVRRREHELTVKLLTEAERRSGMVIRFNLDALLRGDMAARAQFHRTLWEIGAKSSNEVRADEDMNPREGGDRFYVPANFQDGTAAPAARPAAPPPDRRPGQAEGGNDG